MTSYSPTPVPPDPDTRLIVDTLRLVGTVLAVLVGAVLIAGIVLGVVGYDKLVQRLDSIEQSTQRTADELARP